MNNSKLLENAFCSFPVQDKFQQLGFPSTGLSKLEYFALEMYKVNAPLAASMDLHILLKISIEDAITFLNKIDETTKTLLNEKDNSMAIIEP